jgi:hypothetical protein
MYGLYTCVIVKYIFTNILKTLSFHVLCKHTIATIQCQSICREIIHIFDTKFLHLFFLFKRRLIREGVPYSSTTINHFISLCMDLFLVIFLPFAKMNKHFNHVFLTSFFGKYFHKIVSIFWQLIIA